MRRTATPRRITGAKRLSSGSRALKPAEEREPKPWWRYRAGGSPFPAYAIHGGHASHGRDMNGQKASKLCKEQANKTARTITYSQFKEALAELAGKRFKDKSSEDAAQEVYRMIEGKSPVISGVTKSVASPNPCPFESDTTKVQRFTQGSRFEQTGPGGKASGRWEM
ncbi:hypothetical protein cypCar_00028525 [Cyprinus carpio]|nr:hypothetical protein cypCar_00028525 [Cyprinus carpio]